MVKPILQLAHKDSSFALLWTICFLLLALEWETSTRYSYNTRISQCDILIDKAYEYASGVY